MVIDPFELHPDLPKAERPIYGKPVTIRQIREIVDDVAVKMWASPDKTWGHSRVDIERWLRMVVSEAEKIVIEKSD
tara:strand:+ start:101 stop:328 length:228 start_codon:yes stop_codon:yes gene_type:complete